MKLTLTAITSLLLSHNSYAWEPIEPQKQPPALTLEQFIEYSDKVNPATEEADANLAKQCQQIRAKLNKQLKQLTNKNLIADNNKLLKANILLSVHSQQGCSGSNLTSIVQKIK